MSLPLDSDGFLRRACPTCDREFKVYAGGDDHREDDELDPPAGGYWCSYCSVQAPPDSWWTKSQLDMAENVLAREFVGPTLEGFARTASNSSSRLISIEVETNVPEAMDAITETDDMRRMNLACHPQAAVKVLDEWTGSVCCFICGATA